MLRDYESNSFVIISRLSVVAQVRERKFNYSVILRFSSSGNVKKTQINIDREAYFEKKIFFLIDSEWKNETRFRKSLSSTK
jgi:hypothetical protein